MAEERVVLVDASDRELGTAEKIAAHRAGQLHRAFSIFVLDREGRVLLQRRAAGKYHSAGRWANTCCGHPRPGEAVADAAHRRLREEMGFDCPLEPAFSFIYRAAVGNSLVEHELDHVFTGTVQESPRPDPAEVAEWRAVSPAGLVSDLAAHPESYAAWLAPALEGLRSHHIRGFA